MELWQTAYAWLKGNGCEVDKKFCKHEITSHPDYPSLVSLADFLDGGNLSYSAVRTNASCVDQFTFPILIHIQKPGEQYMKIIKDLTEWKNKNPDIEFWTGVTVYRSNNSIWENKNSELYKKENNRNKYTFWALGIIALTLFFLSFLKQSSYLVNTYGLLSICGLAFSVIALRTELGFQSEFIKQVCGAINSGGCETVLKSSYARGVAGISPSDFSIAYFSTQFLLYSASGLYPFLLDTVVMLSYLGILIIIWSVYVQSFILKQFCFICLCIAATLLSQNALAFIIHPTLRDYSMLAAFGMLYMSLLLIFSLIKRLIKVIDNSVVFRC